ncbi:dof zinc finger protein DOF1.3-like [Selaginella moellendorffii]|uniref:dof zinc finger protein DOF1.3-like n=1 Tax=Selaginella moellendorffii TaxID=88036 RepID=UPI000D1C9D23|nr:dof zinc finger protein DOF1.3-like [Selaginella moellendorffii]|eukprot:XP_024541845.1 dof zinc finger protein DOF1.3-like [Selaginella moellendorffii]
MASFADAHRDFFHSIFKASCNKATVATAEPDLSTVARAEPDLSLTLGRRSSSNVFIVHGKDEKDWLRLGVPNTTVSSLPSVAASSLSSAAASSFSTLTPELEKVEKSSNTKPPFREKRTRISSDKSNDEAPMACIFCGGAARFDYYNNKNVNQPRFRCLKCKKKFTPGASLRGAQRKKLAELHRMTQQVCKFNTSTKE